MVKNKSRSACPLEARLGKQTDIFKGRFNSHALQDSALNRSEGYEVEREPPELVHTS